ncbi:MAG: hypothetical protein IKN08_06880 [Bacteroidales bacterium]|nr:hypothetical protein [Bacteroidales bacterium]
MFQKMARKNFLPKTDQSENKMALHHPPSQPLLPHIDRFWVALKPETVDFLYKIPHPPFFKKKRSPDIPQNPRWKKL